MKKEVVKLEDSSEGHKDETRVKTVNHGGSKVKGTMAVKQKPRRYHRDKIIKEELKSLDEQKELIARGSLVGMGSVEQANRPNVLCIPPVGTDNHRC